MKWLAVIVAALVLLATAGCGAVDDAKQTAEERIAEVKRETRKVRKELRRVRKRVVAEVNATLEDLKAAVPQADATTQVPTRRRATTFETFMDDTLSNVDRYWTRTFVAADQPEPRVGRVFIPPGQRTGTACGSAADDMAAFYCPADDTIYVGERIARQIYDSLGDFGVAYVLAHEYAHNVQQELGWFESGTRLTTVAPFELQADCMAGAWGNAVYREGLIDDGDVQEAVRTANAVGDFDRTNPQHHGTPQERADAWLTGYRSGDPSDCRAFVPT